MILHLRCGTENIEINFFRFKIYANQTMLLTSVSFNTPTFIPEIPPENTYFLEYLTDDKYKLSEFSEVRFRSLEWETYDGVQNEYPTLIFLVQQKSPLGLSKTAELLESRAEQ